tara:strand:+ start:229 stop:1167 length:939 start_codon:yes stop_codon:yes gene_type:complete
MKYSEIRTFGTSFTQGGGFEYWRKPTTKKVYEGFTPMKDNTHFEFSWPGQLDKLVDCKVSNYAKCGHGNERIYRLVYEQTTDPKFNPNDILFLFELSGLGRKQIYSSKLEKYGVYNYMIDWKNGAKFKEQPGVNMAFDYYVDEYEENEAWDWIEENYETITKFTELTTDVKATHQQMQQNLTYFLSYCDSIGLNYYIVEDESMLLWSNRISQSSLEKWIPKYLFTDRYGQLSITGLHGMSGHNFTIAEETDKFIDDGHNGYWGNIYAAKMIADELLKRGDVDILKEVDFPTREEIKERVLENINNIPKPKLI